MKRRPRILLNAATAVSLVLCAATAALWARSYRSMDVAGRATAEAGQVQADPGLTPLKRVRLFSVGSMSGRILVSRASVYLTADALDRVYGDGAHRDGEWRLSTYPAAAQWPVQLIPGVGGGLYWDTMGFGHRQQAWTGNVLNVSKVTQSVDDRWIPHWLLAVVTAILPARACARIVRDRRGRRQLRRGLCPTCGYDLRATPDRCPECGTVPTR